MLVAFASLFSFSEEHVPRFSIPNFDKIVHFGFYFIMVLLGVFALKEQFKKRLVRYKARFYVFLFAVGYGIVIEVVQHVFTMTREGDVLDVIANVIGALLGMLTSRILFSHKCSLK